MGKGIGKVASVSQNKVWASLGDDNYLDTAGQDCSADAQIPGFHRCHRLHISMPPSLLRQSQFSETRWSCCRRLVHFHLPKMNFPFLLSPNSPSPSPSPIASPTPTPEIANQNVPSPQIAEESTPFIAGDGTPGVLGFYSPPTSSMDGSSTLSPAALHSTSLSPNHSMSEFNAVIIAVVVTAVVTLVIAFIAFFFSRRLRPAVKVQHNSCISKDDKPLLDSGADSIPVSWTRYESLHIGDNGPLNSLRLLDNPAADINKSAACNSSEENNGLGCQKLEATMDESTDFRITVSMRYGRLRAWSMPASLTKELKVTNFPSFSRKMKRPSSSTPTVSFALPLASPSSQQLPSSSSSPWSLSASQQPRLSVLSSSKLSQQRLASVSSSEPSASPLPNSPSCPLLPLVSTDVVSTSPSPTSPPIAVSHLPTPTLRNPGLPVPAMAITKLHSPEPSLPSSLHTLLPSVALTESLSPIPAPIISPPVPPPPAPPAPPPLPVTAYAFRSAGSFQPGPLALSSLGPEHHPVPSLLIGTSDRSPPIRPKPRATDGAVAPIPARGKSTILPPDPRLKPSFPPPTSASIERANAGKSFAQRDLPKLKPLHWDKVKADPSHSMVWDRLRTGSFVLDEEIIETLFGYNSNGTSKTGTSKSMALPMPVKKHGILDARKAHNIAIQLRALNLSKDDICNSLLEGDGLSSEILEVLVKMAPGQEEQKQLRNFNGDPSQLGPAEHFLMALLEVPLTFERLKAMLFKACLKEDLLQVQESLQILEVACKEVSSSRLFLKLLEAVLKTGNRMNAGTFRGDAEAFKLDTLLKLSDIKSANGKTSLLHFVVEEIIKAEGVRAVRMSEAGSSEVQTTEKSDDEYKQIGLQVIMGLNSELRSVKMAATIEADALTLSVSKLVNGLSFIKVMLETQFEVQNAGNFSVADAFLLNMSSFVRQVEEDVNYVQKELSRVFDKVREATAYFHGSSRETQPLHMFMIVSDFLRLLEKVCTDLGKTFKVKVHG
eukprot:c27210_g1_i3 orf=627-3632(-)